MAESGRYEKTPRPESMIAVRRMLLEHSAVREYSEPHQQLYAISRFGRGDINLYVTNIYTVGVADVQEILDAHPVVNCILTVSAWNNYTSMAKEYAKGVKVGLFRFYELKGALNYDGKSFVDYVSPYDRK
ncbi:hypothetical protein ACFV6F_16875 [Kitasatospora phosalacinea]|uniref:hypothetical protein n=1 Tax=Kitasatospora phosalacinea TaxID=2065 RepID=UPI00365964D1